MLIKDIENDARRILLDDYDGAYRFEPQEIFQAIKNAMVNLRGIRPESRYFKGFLCDEYFRNGNTPVQSDIPSAIGEAMVEVYRNYTVVCEDHWRTAIVYYVVHAMYLKDDPDTSNLNLSKEYFTKYTAAAQT